MMGHAMKPDTYRRFALPNVSDSADHWADEFPRNLTLEAAELIEIPYTCLGRPALIAPFPQGPSC
ncbi:protein of unknown function (plasmid) [Cupriavidus neocaledonicus]|uniref:Uncharacterized protein n=1 Tax=Cupriavidus neocaledonicus TaxID=1040979 RepID=A0A375HQT0_9BURK|nr:hypothetical protein CBM2605_B150005 [Cupriavidus neocaledonicus]SPD59100.1 protein of unknown function [Cupriavidus neocaledonicus]